MNKYDKDAKTFMDPVVRCTDCAKLVYRTEIRDYGMCTACGNKRMRNVLVLSEPEMVALKAKDIDPEFLALFEGVKDE